MKAVYRDAKVALAKAGKRMSRGPLRAVPAIEGTTAPYPRPFLFSAYEMRRRRQIHQRMVELTKLAELAARRGVRLPGVAQTLQAMEFLATHGTHGRIRMPGFGTFTFDNCMKRAEGCWPPPRPRGRFRQRRASGGVGGR